MSTATAVPVWDVASERVRMVTPAQAVAGLLAYARTLGLGTPAAAVATRRALDLAAEHGLTPAVPITPRG